MDMLFFQSLVKTFACIFFMQSESLERLLMANTFSGKQKYDPYIYKAISICQVITHRRDISP